MVGAGVSLTSVGAVGVFSSSASVGLEVDLDAGTAAGAALEAYSSALVGLVVGVALENERYESVGLALNVAAGIAIDIAVGVSM